MWGLKRWQDWGCRGAATMLIRPWVYSHTQNGVFRGRLKHTHARTPRTHLHNHSFKHLSSNTLAYTRRRIQRSTWGVTVEREGHWEMFLATCRASILRAASTSSSWAAHKGDLGGGGGKGRGIAAQGWESKRKTYIHLSWAGTYLLSIISHSINLFHTVS